jgi:hypothetical protein
VCRQIHRKEPVSFVRQKWIDADRSLSS